MSLSVIIIMLYANSSRVWASGRLSSFDIKIGGLNDTELFDLKQLSPVFPENSEAERYGAWSANFRIENVFSNALFRMNSPPVEIVAPFISRVKSWGYKMTSYNGYVTETHFHTDSSEGPEVGMVPILSHTWILEKESELVFLSPAPRTTQRT